MFAASPKCGDQKDMIDSLGDNSHWFDILASHYLVELEKLSIINFMEIFIFRIHG